jgi:4-aminobutyrate aminotransferase-like enzyme
MQDHFGHYSEADLEIGRNAYAGGSVGAGKPITIVEHHGSTFTDDQGNEYIDCTAQAWSLNVGGCHPRIINAVMEQMRHATHIRSGYGTIPKYLLNKRLTEIAPGNLKKVSWCLHGSVANEGAIKLALRNRPHRRYFLTPWRSFFGRTLATMDLSWPHLHHLFDGYTGNVVHFPHAYCYRCPFDLSRPECELACAKFLRQTIKHCPEGPPAAVFMEPMQAGGGMIEYPADYLKEVRAICDEHDILLVWDEIQTAFGRMGSLFAAELYNVIPDIMSFGKAIGGGFPLAGTLNAETLEGYGPQDHGFTFASFPISMAAGIVTLQILEDEKLPERAASLGENISNRLQELQDQFEIIGDIRGPGLMIGIELVKNRETKEPAVSETIRFIEEGLKRGVLFGELGYQDMMNVVKIKPPLVITDGEVERVLEVFEEILEIVS